MVAALILLAFSCLFWTPQSRVPVLHRLAPVVFPVSTLPVIFIAFIIFGVVVGIDLASIFSACMIGVAAMWQARRLIRARKEQKQATAISRFIAMCAANLRAGTPLEQAMRSAVETLAQSGRVFEVLSAALRGAQSGRGAAMLIGAEQKDLSRFGVLWEVSEKHGIPLVILMEQLRERIDSLDRHRRATNAALQGPQATAIILALLPLGGLLLGTAMGAHPLAFLTGGGLGGLLLILGVTLAVAGFMITQMILSKAGAT